LAKISPSHTLFQKLFLALHHLSDRLITEHFSQKDFFMSDHKNTRRSFLKQIIVGAAVLPVAGSLCAQSASAQTVPNKAIDSSDPMAGNVGYVSDGTKVDKAKYPKYAAGQQCKGCVLYLEGGKTVEGQTGEYGRCGLFMNGLVAAGGWCNSFAAKVV
jgi:hypothetical protein